uniref:Uncharacterized protein n=1 Tax=Ditylenchus dipsaci TaxID=166011 RepID=A0A915CR96_9BILA
MLLSLADNSTTIRPYLGVLVPVEEGITAAAELVTATLMNYLLYSISYLTVVSVTYVTIAPIPVIFVTLDRCWALKHYGEKMDGTPFKMLVANIFTIVFASFISIAFFCVVDWFNLKSKFSDCTDFFCSIFSGKVVINVYAKDFFGSINIICSGYFFFLLSREKSINIKNTIVKAILIIEILFVLIPTYSCTFYKILTGLFPFYILGPYVVMLCMIDAACGSIIYTIVFVRRKRKVKIRSITIIGKYPPLKLRQHHYLSQAALKRL